MSREVVVVDGVRTPYSKAGTELKDVPAQELARIVTVEVLARTNFDGKDLDGVVFGNIGEPPDAVNVSRVGALLAGVPASVPAFTVNRLCGSGLESIVEAYYRIAAGDADAMVAGGVESMSNLPLLYPKEGREALGEVFVARSVPARIAAAARLRPRHFKPQIGLLMGLTDPVCGLNMGETAEVLAKENGITREEQDLFALRSHQRVTMAREKLAEEIVPVPIPPRYEALATKDNGVRENQSIEALAKLSPVFDRKFGTVTAGNSSQITDGGAAALVMSAGAAKSRGYRPLGKIRGFAFCALEPERMGLGPAVAVPLALKRAGVAWSEIGLVEFNEAFAAQVLANAKVFPSAAWHAKYGTGGPIGEL
ncbi:MAG TPA: thiolase family protein, partial [bacterium]|nr:thiolase family protein [bacterium]